MIFDNRKTQLPNSDQKSVHMSGIKEKTFPMILQILYRLDLTITCEHDEDDVMMM